MFLLQTRVQQNSAPFGVSPTFRNAIENPVVPAAAPAAPTPRDALLARIRRAQAEVDSHSGVGNSIMRFIERIGGQEQDLNDLHQGAQNNLQRLQRELAALEN